MKPGKITASQADTAVATRPAPKPPALATPATVKAPNVEAGMGPAFGMAQVIAGLLRQASAESPQRAADLRGTVALQSSDYVSGVTIHFEGERIRVEAEMDPDALLLIEGPVLTFGKLGSFGYSAKAFLRREIRIRGMLRHPALLNKVRIFVKPLGLS